MRTSRSAIFVIVIALIIGLTACGGTDRPVQGGAEEISIPAAEGADSVKTLLEKTVEYIRSGGDYSKIASVHDQRAWIAMRLAYVLFDSDFSSETVDEADWQQLMDWADLFYGSADRLREKDPELYDMIVNAFDGDLIVDLDEYVNEAMNELKDSIRSGYITEDDPEYEVCRKMFEDWDKGSEYMYEHYEEFRRGPENGWYFFTVDQFLEYMRKAPYTEPLLPSEIVNAFRDFEFEYHPENIEIGRNGGVFEYGIGFAGDAEGYGGYSLGMVYYVENETYYLVEYGVVVY